jgi:hypothetical protein
MAKKKKADVGRHEMIEVKLSELKAHPRNYRQHTEDQLEHIVASLKGAGVYRNVVVAEDNTILAGHGVIKAAGQIGMESFPVIRLPVAPDSVEAIKVLTGDNEIARMAFQDDRALTELLKEVRDATSAEGLIGTGYDEKMLAALAMVTRPKSEIADLDKAAEWVGMPEFPDFDDPFKVTVNFETEDDKMKFFKLLGYEDRVTEKTKKVWYPWKDKRDMGSVEYVEEDDAD